VVLPLAKLVGPFNECLERDATIIKLPEAHNCRSAIADNINCWLGILLVLMRFDKAGFLVRRKRYFSSVVFYVTNRFFKRMVLAKVVWVNRGRSQRKAIPENGP
jgi:hypothetical protein